MSHLNNIYQRAKENGIMFECTCVDIGIREWDKLMKGHTRANRKEVIKIALEANDKCKNCKRKFVRQNNGELSYSA